MLHSPRLRPKTAPPTVNTHTFRDRQKAKERLISSREFGVHYETEKDRIQRIEAEHQFLRLARDPWAPGQTAP
eukprot:s73_g11.t1